MKWVKEHGPAYTVLKVSLETGESVYAEPGAMMLIRGDVEVSTESGGILSGLKRSLLGGESFFLNRYTAGPGGGEVWLVPGVPGDIAAIELSGDSWVIQDTSYLAHYGDVKVSTAFRGLRGLLTEGELFWLKAEGYGIVWVNSYGAIEEVEVAPGETLVVDNMHFVAMPESVDYRVRKLGGMKTFIFGGEGLVVEVHGPARVLVQTRILPPLARLLSRYLPKRD